jgi:hypothetical protein
LEVEKTVNSQGNMSKKSNGQDITIPDFKLYYRAMSEEQHCIGRKTDMKMFGTE